MQLILPILGLALILFLIQEGLRRAGKWVTWIAILGLPLALTPYWLTCNEFGIFEWGKLYTILITACWLTALRFTRLYHRPWARLGLTALFGLNILEAVVVDLAAGQLASSLNAAAGLLLIVMLPRSPHAISRHGKFADLNYEGVSLTWIIAFTLWNLTFLYVNYPVIFGHHIAVLGVPMIVSLFKRQRWLEVRINLLALDLLMLATFASLLIPPLDTARWHDPKLDIVAGGATLTLSMLCLMEKAFMSRIGERASVGGKGFKSENHPPFQWGDPHNKKSH
jgi:hypothetical protein|tara:strand:- start:149 stop:991 length:843 start_codon:yes stop_codon:yes gene_type:complete